MSGAPKPSEPLFSVMLSAVAWRETGRLSSEEFGVLQRALENVCVAAAESGSPPHAAFTLRFGTAIAACRFDAAARRITVLDIFNAEP